MVLLGVTKRYHPFALLPAFEKVVASAQIDANLGASGGQEARSFHLPRLVEVAGWGLLLRDHQDGQHLPPTLRAPSCADEQAAAYVKVRGCRVNAFTVRNGCAFSSAWGHRFAWRLIERYTVAEIRSV